MQPATGPHVCQQARRREEEGRLAQTMPALIGARRLLEIVAALLAAFSDLTASNVDSLSVDMVLFFSSGRGAFSALAVSVNLCEISARIRQFSAII